MKYKALLDLNMAIITSYAMAYEQKLQFLGLFTKRRIHAQTPAIENNTIPAFCLGILSTIIYRGIYTINYENCTT